MGQACWWRLIAEEIRTEGDQLAFEPAKQTMWDVALSYARLAEDLEKRLANPRYENLLVPTQARRLGERGC